MQFIKTSGNKVDKILSGSKLPDGYTVVPNDHELIVGDDVRFFDKDYQKKTVQQSIDEGLISVESNETAVWENGGYVVKPDYRETNHWYKNTGEAVEFEIGDEPDETMTDIEPIDHEAIWDETNNQWYVPDEVKADRIREERSRLLTESDYIMMPDYPITEPKRSEWETYRQALRDITKQSKFPISVEWPTKPNSL